MQIHFKDFGLDLKFVQDNEVYSGNAGILRGLHYQLEKPQGKLVHAVTGAIKDVIVDVRIGSPNYGKSITIDIDSKSHNMVYVPEGYAHGYLVLEKNTIVQYKCTDFYDPRSEYGIKWDDEELKINWGISKPILNEKDKNLPKLKNQKNLPVY